VTVAAWPEDGLRPPALSIDYHLVVRCRWLLLPTVPEHNICIWKCMHEEWIRI